MRMFDPIHSAAQVAVIAVVTALLRFLPFLLFLEGKKRPTIIDYLCRYLPAAIIGMLVVYCLRNTVILSTPHGIPELVAVVVVAVLHIWKRNNLLSIGVGTVLYMVLIQTVF